MQTQLAAARSIPAPPEAVAAIIMNVAELAVWNPALLSVQTQDSTAVVGRRYSVSTRVPGRANLTYERTGLASIAWRLVVPGGVELGAWAIHATATGTRVTHEIRLSGPTFALLRNAMRPVPGLRLECLETRVLRAAR